MSIRIGFRAMSLLHVFRTVLALRLLIVMPLEVASATTFDWQGSSGQLPTEITPAWQLENTSPTSPNLMGGILTLEDGGTNATVQLYLYEEPTVNTSDGFSVEARLRFVSGSSTNNARAPIAIGYTNAANVGNVLWIGQDDVFLLAGDQSRGQTASVDTDSAFHTFLIDVASNGSVAVTYDGNPLLTGDSFFNANFRGSESIFWGQGTTLANGVSEWEYVTVATVPEPSGMLLATIAGYLLVTIEARKRWRSVARLS